MNSVTVEGSLDILWLNAETTATPKYDLIFATYAGFRNGAQQPNKKVGPVALESYLVELGFSAEDTENWLKQVHQHVSVSIPNVMMPGEHLVDYGL